MTDTLRRGPDDGLVWDSDLFAATIHRIPSFGQAYESVTAGRWAGHMSLTQLQEEFRVH